MPNILLLNSYMNILYTSTPPFELFEYFIMSYLYFLFDKYNELLIYTYAYIYLFICNEAKGSAPADEAASWSLL